MFSIHELDVYHSVRMAAIRFSRPISAVPTNDFTASKTKKYVLFDSITSLE